MKKCCVCNEKVVEFRNPETGEEVCEECMNKEVAAAKAAKMTEPTYEAIAIEVEPAETETPTADETLEEAEVLDDDTDQTEASAPKEESSEERTFKLRDVPPEIEEIKVKCHYCGKEGKAGDITDDGKVRYAWHNLPADMNAESEPEAVCLKCAKEHDKKHRKRFYRWFQKHSTLPVLPYTLMAKAKSDEKRQALKDKARQWGKDRGIEHDPNRVCSVCGAVHGDLTETRHPYYHFLVIEVSTVVGTPATRQDMMTQALLCNDCRRDAIGQAKDNGVRLQLRRYDEMDEEFARRDRLAKVMGPGVEQRYEPLGTNQKDSGRRRKNNHWKTGTDDRG